ncbi:unnamed protein product, partial [Rotaria magnacalcarata]
MTVARRKRPKHTRTTTTTISQEFFRPTELLREMTITSSQ